jgi:hypothetical protein
MPKKLTASMPEQMDLDANYAVRWAALDPDTGADVAGVTVSNASMLVTQVSPGSLGDLSDDNFVPLYTPVTLEDQAAPDDGEG